MKAKENHSRETYNNATHQLHTTPVLESLLVPLKEYIFCPAVTDLMVNPDGSIHIDKAGRLISTSKSLSKTDRFSILRELAGFYDLVINKESPELACKLPGDIPGRVQAFIPPITDGPSFCIRFPARSKLSLKQLVKRQFMTQEQADSLVSYVQARKNILIAGGTGSGKTTLANALLDVIRDERLVIIEDTSEIIVKNVNTVYMFTLSHFTARDAVRTSLRYRPDRIILGEVRDGAALEWVKASLTGHPGSLVTLHADSAAGVRDRLYSLIQEAVPNPSYQQIDSAVDYAVFVSRDPKGFRKLQQITALKELREQIKGEEAA